MLTDFLFFTHPLALFLTTALPLLWVLFKLLPLKPRRVIFPAMVLFHRKKADAPAPRDIPVWLKILRLLTVFFLIMFLAKPVYDRGGDSVTLDPTLLVIDNSWSSAIGWQDRIDVISSRLDSFINVVGVPVAIVTTAPDKDTGKPIFAADLSPSEAKSFVRSIEPQPWDSDYDAAGMLVKSEFLLKQGPKWNTYWFSDGQGGKAQSRFFDDISSYGEVTLYNTPAFNQGIAIAAVTTDAQELVITVTRRNATEETTQSLAVFSNDGSVLMRSDITLDQGEYGHEERLRIPKNILKDIQRIQIFPDTHAASTWYMDKTWQQPKIGIWTDRPTSQKQDYLNDVFYIAQAAEVSAEVVTGSVQDLIADEELSLLVIPDSTQPTGEDYDLLKNWINEGGSLLRFAGKNLIKERAPQLLPVKIYGGERSFGGAMSWGTPAKLGGVADDSPLGSIKAELERIADFTIKQQVLARPAIDLKEKSWAWIEDQSPLITQQSLGEGQSILVHTSADTAWSDMAISEFFPIMFSTLSKHAMGAIDNGLGETMVYPSRVYDAYGDLTEPGFLAEQISTSKMDETNIGPKFPAGLYSTKGHSDQSTIAYNYGQTLNDLTLENEALEIDLYDQVLSYDEKTYIDLSVYFLWLTIILFIVDCVLTFGLIHGRKVFSLSVPRKVFLLIFSMMFMYPASGVLAQDRLKNKIDLAYVITEDTNRDTISRKGLSALGEVLKRRTTVEFNDVAGVDPARDDLSRFPFIYWPMTASQSPLSEAARANIQFYLDHGGMIVFDTRDAQFAETDSTLGQESLQRIMQGIQVGPLVTLPPDHVLKRSYYLLEEFPGLYKGGDIWVENVAETDYDGVPTVIIGSHDWAAAWASSNTGRFALNAQGTKKEQYEHALRFGVNLVMMSLTGSYKKDQVHIKYILERFDRD